MQSPHVTFELYNFAGGNDLPVHYETYRDMEDAMSLLNLPDELIVFITNYLEQSQSLSRFARTNRRIYNIVRPLVYQHNIKYGKCSGLKAQISPLQCGDYSGQVSTVAEEDLEEYNNPSALTTPEGLPVPVTDQIRIRDAVISQFVEYGVNIDNLQLYESSDPIEMSLLHYHVADRNSPAVFLMAKHGADIHATNGYKTYTTLHWAATGGCAKIIRFLISKGVDVNARTGEETTPLHVAAEEGHEAAIRLLCENGADINAQDKEGCTPLHLMMMNGELAGDPFRFSALKAVLELGPDTELGMFEDGKTALHLAILHHRDEEFMETVLESGMDPNSRTVDGRTPLSCCLERVKMRLFTTLIKKGADIHSRDEAGRTLLQIALENKDRAYGCLPKLLESGLFTLNSDAGDGKTLVQFLKEESWLSTIRGRVDGMPEIDELESD